MATVYELADQMLDGQLADMLARWDAEKVPRWEMAWRLRDQHGIQVSGETVRRWLAEHSNRKAP